MDAHMGLLAAGLMFLGLRLLRVAGVLTVAFAWILRNGFARRRRIDPRPWAPGQLGSEARAAAGVLLLDAAVAATIVVAAGGVQALQAHWAAPAAIGPLATFVLVFVWYEAWFYATHRLLHTRRFYGWHRQHHTAAVCSPLTAFSFSVGERLLLVGGLLVFIGAASAVTSISALGVLAYGVVNQLLNVLGHCNVECLPAGLSRHRAGRWIVTPTFHALHHARRRGHFGLFTTVADRCFGTVEGDYDAVFDRAAGR